ncbi:30S ribosomal protein S18 [Candidatus Solincola tengchongensis]|uniref:30S ribosomal protein S18 n=1 Tax=Candidatus Solincola tengchongensis TaxID=2900693 RepID=UPI0017739D5D|nr:30S ribosomal protein S18 [Candidatus Solincola tengchongensis]MBC7254396.1 30S ribosomal protein S18 [Actinomycetota bacterium]
MSSNQSKKSSSKDKKAKEGYGRKQRKKVCYFCSEKVDYIDYKDTNLLKKFLSEKGKIRPRRVTGNCAQHQKRLALAIKNAREMALIPYTSRQGEIK